MFISCAVEKRRHLQFYRALENQVQIRANRRVEPRGQQGKHVSRSTVLRDFAGIRVRFQVSNVRLTQRWYRVIEFNNARVCVFYREIDEKVYEAYVKEKKEAKEDYMQAINAGQTAAHVEQK